MFFDRHTGDWVAAQEASSENIPQEPFLAIARARIEGRVLIGETSKVQQYERGVGATEMAYCGIRDGGTEGVVEPIQDDSEALAILRDCSVVLGLHPDSAAEPLIDFALRYVADCFFENKSVRCFLTYAATNRFEKPFAVVPCCTCSKEFPDRMLNQ